MSNNLKPCPFCGSEAEVHISAVQDKIRVQVECENCHTYKERTETGRNDLNSLLWIVKETELDWNTRPVDDKKDTTVADLDIENAHITYRGFDDLVVLHTAKGPVTVRREWFDKARFKVAELYEESQMFDWTATESGYTCDNCKTESRYAFKTCPSCGEKMRNGFE